MIGQLLPFIPRSIVDRVARPYIAGPTLDHAVAAVRNLNLWDMTATMAILGEHVHQASQCEMAVQEYLELLGRIHQERLNAQISVKLTQLGLELGDHSHVRRLETILTCAAHLGIFSRIDMEGSTHTQETLRTYVYLREHFPHIGVVIQAMLIRSAHDVRWLGSIKANVRLCKGIYRESHDIAYQDRSMIRDNYMFLLRQLAKHGCFVSIATHDEYLLECAYDMIDRGELAPGTFEFSFLMGVRPRWRFFIVQSGHPMRVYTPWGKRAREYSIRRMQENPALAWTVARSFFTRQ